jgi:hypothetical protein
MIVIHPHSVFCFVIWVACQKKAWRAGHKSKCLELKIKHYLFENNFAWVEQMHGKEGESILKTQVEYFVAAESVEFDRMFGPFLLNDVQAISRSLVYVPGPSMSFFYKNLHRIFS